ncbi:Bcr/CflA family drug resistance efflux transporter [Marinobacterium nitratireducens]|uniref:Bcr/CflA family efflux transporter n=1 Tax=Marinobacterium nitratireducens TaxID=518897 RepID=A0A917ZGK5_9GAMM|nr:Bcr/CflA family multidrug efflux MFS transporter [Marinobacterium nitratireducens]GGO82366.1 Bcr/CflA family drug resistance efflux transporter [Marinobacterium nitratireducens]
MKTEKAFIPILGLLIGLTPLAIDMYLPSMPAIAAGLGASAEAVQQTLTVFLIAFSLPQLLFGPLSDALGRRPVIMLGLVLFVGGSLLCAMAPGIGWLLAARAVQAAGAAAIAVSVPALVKDRYSNEAFARTMSFIMMVMAVAPLLAPLLGGLVLNFGSWRLVFGTLTLIAVIGLLLFCGSIPETLQRQKRTPLRIRPQLRNYRQLLCDRHAFCHMLSAGFMFAGMMAFVAASPFVYIELYAVPAQYYGLLFGLNVLTLMSLSMLANRFITLGSRRILTIAFGLIALVVVLLLSLSLLSRPPLAALVIASMLFIGTYGVISAHTLSVVMNRFPAISGSVSALGGTLRFGTGSFGGAAVGLLHDDSASAMTLAMAACGILALLSFVCALQAAPARSTEAAKEEGCGGI